MATLHLYVCKKCGFEFEEFNNNNPESNPCPKCNETEIMRQFFIKNYMKLQEELKEKRKIEELPPKKDVIHNYKCKNCEHTFQEWVSVDSENKPCPKCNEIGVYINFEKFRFIDRSREYNWTKGLTAREQAAVLLDERPPY